MDAGGTDAALITETALEALRRLIVGICHEINNSLTAASGLADLLSQEETDAARKEDLAVILEETNRAVQAARNLRAFARTSSAPSLCSVEEVVRQVTAARAHELRMRNIEVQVVLADPPFFVWARPEDLLLAGLLLAIQAEDLAELSEEEGVRIFVTTSLRHGYGEVGFTVKGIDARSCEESTLDFLHAAKALAERFQGHVAFKQDFGGHSVKMILEMPTQEQEP